MKSALLAVASLAAARAKSATSVPLSASWFAGGPRLLVDVSPASNGEPLPAQRLLLDTGSSTLAFCQNSLLQEAAYEETGYVSCNMYNPGGNFTGYWGPFVAGDVAAGNLSMPNSSYSVMAEQVGMPCDDGIQGIFGIAFAQLDAAIAVSDFSNQSNGTCPLSASKLMPPPLLHQLQASGEVEMLGIYWSGQLGEQQGRLFVDEGTVNEHYKEEALAGPADLGELGWYDVAIQRISVGDEDFGNFSCTGNATGQCIMDTGTPTLVLPQAVVNSSSRLLEQGEPANLTIWLRGASGDVPVTFDLATLGNMSALEVSYGDDVGIILGLPLWAFHYTVFNITGRTVSFIPHQTAPSSGAPAAEDFVAETGGRRAAEAELPVHV